MGLIQSILCTFSLCVERVLTWTMAAIMLMLTMLMLIVLMAYGISVGYHYAQRELAAFASISRESTTIPATGRRAGDVVHLVAVNKTMEHLNDADHEYRTEGPKEHIFIEPTVTPVVLLESERPPPKLSLNERNIAKQIITRFRRSRNTTDKATSIKNDTNLFRFLIPNT